MPPFSVTVSLDRYVAKLEEPREPDGHWHPSGLFGCPRKAIYEMRATPQSDPPDERAKRVFRVGHILHEFIQAAILDDSSVVAFYAEVKILDEERRIKGSVDGLIKLSNGVWLVLEFKSINSNAFRYGDLPKEDHKGQASVYLQLLRNFGGTGELADGTPVEIPPLGEDLTRARFAYVSKDDLKVEEYELFWTDEKARVIEERLYILESYEELGELPPRLPPTVKTNKKTGKTTTSRNYLCGYCSFRTKCWDEDPEGVEL